MSYILDALKKADQKRKLGVVPGLQTDHAAVVNIEKKRRFSLPLVALVAGGLLLNGGLWFWWSRPWQVAPPHVVAPVAQPQPVVALARETALPPAPPAPEQTPQVDENMDLPENPVAYATSPVAVVAEPVANEEVAAPVLSYPEEQIVETISPDETGGGEAVAPTQAGDQAARVMAQADLPVNIQQALPQINISLHFFSNRPEARLVRINDRHLHEGDMVANDLRLLEITEEGAVLSFRSYRFRVDKL